jgi:hypothetical protein
MVRCGAARCGVVWCGVVWCGQWTELESAKDVGPGFTVHVINVTSQTWLRPDDFVGP